MLRRYADLDAPYVRAIFIRVNRELAPPALRTAFENYIDLSLQNEINRISDYYGEGLGQGFWVAEYGGQLVGFFGLEPAGKNVAELRRMYVVPEVRRRGIASAMLAEAERLCAFAGLQRLALTTSELQSAAIALYLRSGFRVVRENRASEMTIKTIGGGIRRIYFEKEVCMGVAFAGRHSIR